MTFSNINTSTPNDGLGDKLRDAFNIVNYNFSQIEDQVSLTELNTILGSYSTITQLNSVDNDLQTQIDSLDVRLDNDELEIITLQSDITSLGLLVNGKASLTQLNNSIANVNDAISAQQVDIDNKIDEAPIDGFAYVRKDGNWVKLNDLI